MNTTSGFITLTDIDVDRCRTERGGFRSDTVSLLGENIKISGWRRRLRGKRIPRSIYEQAKAVGQLPKLKHVPHGEAKNQIPLFI